jgi:dTDP-4-dehydrorhamnose reductase
VHVIIGGDGLLGAALRDLLTQSGTDYIATSRRVGANIPWPRSFYFDLAQPIPELPPGEVVYIVAAIPHIVTCERDPVTWTVNADAPIAIAKQYAARGEFVVFVSSDAVTHADSFTYGKQKTYAEAYMNTINAAIIRPRRFTKTTADILAAFIWDVGNKRLPGVFKWPQ